MKNFYLLSPNEITIDVIKEVLNIESNIYPVNEQQSLRLCIENFNVNPNIYFIFKDLDNGKIVGNVDICPITDRCYEKIKSGMFKDSNIASDMIVSYRRNLDECYNLYFEGITIREEYRDTGLLFFMFKSLNRFFNRDICIRRIIADAVTDDGIRLCKMFRMKEICRTDHNSIIFEKHIII